MITGVSVVPRRTVCDDIDWRFDEPKGSIIWVTWIVNRQHYLKTNHKIDWDSAKCVTYNTNLSDEIKYLDNNYNWDFIRQNIYRISEPNATNTNSVPVTTATIPCIKGFSEIIPRILQPYNIRVAHKPVTSYFRTTTDKR